jgi:hypothetical protein
MALETKLETTLTPGLDKQTLGKTNIATESNRSQTQTLPIPKENPFSFPTNNHSRFRQTNCRIRQTKFLIPKNKKGLVKPALTSALLANIQSANDLKISLWIMLSYII